MYPVLAINQAEHHWWGAVRNCRCVKGARCRGRGDRGTCWLATLCHSHCCRTLLVFSELLKEPSFTSPFIHSSSASQFPTTRWRRYQLVSRSRFTTSGFTTLRYFASLCWRNRLSNVRGCAANKSWRVFLFGRNWKLGHCATVPNNNNDICETNFDIEPDPLQTGKFSCCVIISFVRGIYCTHRLFAVDNDINEITTRSMPSLDYLLNPITFNCIQNTSILNKHTHEVWISAELFMFNFSEVHNPFIIQMRWCLPV